MSASFEKLLNYNGLYSRHFLIKLHDINNNIVMRYINDLVDTEYNGEVYKAAGFSYKAAAAVLGFDGGGTLEIDSIENKVIDLARTYKEIRLEVVGVLKDNGEVEELKKYRHHYGKARMSNMKMTFTFEPDDRPGMTFPALIWNATNNHGNS